jgi:hypothetical protein
LEEQSAQSCKLEGDRTVIVFFTLDFKHAGDIPKTLSHELHVRSLDGARHTLTAEPLVVQQRAPVVVAASLRGPGWIAGDSTHNGLDAAHRRAILSLVGERLLRSAMRLIGYVIGWSMV